MKAGAKWIVLLILMMSPAIQMAQDPAGEYIGYHDAIYSAAKRPLFNNRHFFNVLSQNTYRLILNPDSSFSYFYNFNNASSAVGVNQYHCTGRWTINMDTLIINSKYSHSDFIRVTEDTISHHIPGLIMIAWLPDQDSISISRWVWFVNAFIDSKEVGVCNKKDTLYCKAHELSKIMFRSESPYSMEWEYIPQSKSANYFIIDLITGRENGENTVFSNYRFLIKGNQLLPLDGKPITLSKPLIRRVP